MLSRRGDIDAVAEHVVALVEHIAEVDADAQLHPARFGQVEIARRYQALDIDGAMDRFEDADEFGSETEIQTGRRLKNYPMFPICSRESRLRQNL
jgi:hypothetical protein